MSLLYTEATDELRADIRRVVELLGGTRATAEKTGLDDRYITRILKCNGVVNQVGEIFLDTLFSKAGLPHYMMRYEFGPRKISPSKRKFSGGVFEEKTRGYWRIQPYFDGKRYYIGNAPTEEQARVFAQEFYNRVKTEIEAPQEVAEELRRRAGTVGNR